MMLSFELFCLSEEKFEGGGELGECDGYEMSGTNVFVGKKIFKIIKYYKNNISVGREYWMDRN